MRNKVHRFKELLPIIFLGAFCLQGNASSATQAIGSRFVVSSSKANAVEHVFIVAKGRIVCLDLQSGKLVWSEKAPGIESTENPGAGPVLTDSDIVYMAGGGSFTAYALDRAMGKSQWTKELPSSALAASSDAIFLATQGGSEITSIEGKNGKVRWEYRAAGAGEALTKIVYSRGHLYSTSRDVWDANDGKVVGKLVFAPDALTAADGRVFVTGEGSPVVAIDAGTNRILWQAGNPITPSSDKPYDQFVAASDKYAAVAFLDGAAYDAKRSLIQVYNVADGKFLWKLELLSHSKPFGSDLIGVDEKKIYVLDAAANGDSEIRSFDALNGKLLWTYSAQTIKFIGPVVSVDNTLLVRGFDSDSHRDALYALDTSTGAIYWVYQIQ